MLLPDPANAPASSITVSSPPCASDSCSCSRQIRRRLERSNRPTLDGLARTRYASGGLRFFTVQPNVERKGRPRIRRIDMPTKPGHGLSRGNDRGVLDARRRIVASVATRTTEAS